MTPVFSYRAASKTSHLPQHPSKFEGSDHIPIPHNFSLVVFCFFNASSYSIVYSCSIPGIHSGNTRVKMLRELFIF